MNGIRATVDRDQGRDIGEPLGVVVGEPRALTRLGFDCCLTEHGFSVRGQAADAAGTAALALAQRPAICLLAGNLPDGTVTALAEIRSGAPETRVVVMVEHESVTEARDCIGAGAAGYLSKDIACDSLARALRCVARGEATVSRKMARRLLTDRRATTGTANRSGVLTMRQHQVLELLSRGATTAEVARSLSISPVTARRHRGELRRKLAIRDGATEATQAHRRLPLTSDEVTR